MYHIIHLDRDTDVTSFLKGYFDCKDKALNELDRIITEYAKYPNLFSDYKISIVQDVFMHVHDSNSTGSINISRSELCTD